MANDPIVAPVPTPADPGVKPGYSTSEFWITLLTLVGSIAAQASGTIPPPWGAVVAGISAAAYAISRGLAKSG